MKVAIIKYNAGNGWSVFCSLKRLGVEPVITGEPEEIMKADKVIFPGVGEAGSAMRHLKEKGLDRVIRNLTCPVLGICLGMQLMCSRSEEGDTECLGIFDQLVVRFPPDKKVPHTGWNWVAPIRGDLAAEKSGYFYFVHSYYTRTGMETTMTCNYIQEFSAGMQKDNFHAVQFHPEKSGDRGEELLRRFLDLPGRIRK